MAINQEKSYSEKPSIAADPIARRFLAKNAQTMTLSTSRSTPSLPNLVNYAISSATATLSKRQLADLSTTMRRGRSQQDAMGAVKVTEQPKKPM
jgi:carbonic anhydrase